MTTQIPWAILPDRLQPGLDLRAARFQERQQRVDGWNEAIPIRLQFAKVMGFAKSSTHPTHYTQSYTLHASDLPAQRPTSCCRCSGYRAPYTVIPETALSMLPISSGVRFTAAAPTFSSRRCSFVVPGIGTIHGFRASSQAIAIWAGVACFRAAILPSRSTTAWFAFLASGA